VLVQANAMKIPLADESVDLVFTDPPYDRESLGLLGPIAQEASRVLRPDGFLLLMTGSLYLDRVFEYIGRSGLGFFWELRIVTPRRPQTIWRNNGNNNRMAMVVRSKPILAFGKGHGIPRCPVLDTIIGGGSDKTWHHWGQDVASARYFIDCFTKEGDLVLDPMVGGGTTLAACELIGRRWIGMDLDWNACVTSRNRMNDSDLARPLPLFAFPASGKESE